MLDSIPDRRLMVSRWEDGKLGRTRFSLGSFNAISTLNEADIERGNYRR